MRKYSKTNRLLKRKTKKKSRSRPVTDETPYKRLDDKWNYD